MYDITFISYQEPTADENWQLLKERFPTARRVHGVKGIHQAHIAAAKKCYTDLFWIVDGDAQIVEDFDFRFKANQFHTQMVHIWRSKNPVNGLVYGYGGVKLFPRQLTIDMDVSKPDMTTSISKDIVIVREISNITAFNTDAYSTWKSAFRECAKLASKVINRQKNDETDERLNVWTTVGEDKPFGKYAIEGAKMGREWGTLYKEDFEKLFLINDFSWLRQKFEETYGS